MYLAMLDAAYDPSGVLLVAEMPDSLGFGEGATTVSDWVFPVARITAPSMMIGQEIDRPAIVFVCDVHSREWTSSEACVALIDDLVQNASDPDISALLNSVEV